MDDTTRALKELQGLELQGRDIRLDVPRDKASMQRQGHRPGQGRSQEKSGALRPASTSQQVSVFIGNLSFEVDEQTLQEMLTDVVGENTFQRVHLARDRETGRPRGFAHVTFPDVEAAKRAIQELDGLEMIDRTLRVDMAMGLKGRPTSSSPSTSSVLAGRKGTSFDSTNSNNIGDEEKQDNSATQS